MRRLVQLCLPFGVLLVGLNAQTAFAETVSTTPSLSGETLSGTAQLSAHCNADGSGYITFTASGTSSAPYVGTFQESGILSFGPPLSGGLHRQDFAAAYSINSTALPARIRGAKYEFNVLFHFTCQDLTPGFQTGASDNVVYQASIYRTDQRQRYYDTGRSDFTVIPGFFVETFASSKGPLLTSNDGDRASASPDHGGQVMGLAPTSSQ